MIPYYQHHHAYQYNPIVYPNNGYNISNTPPMILYSNKKLENMNCICQGNHQEGALYIGDIISTKKMDILECAKIQAILACAIDRNPNHVQTSRINIQKKLIHCSDSMDYPIKNHFQQAFQFIQSHRSNKKNILVHCHAGVSRSAAIICAYLMKKYKLKAIEALNLIKRKRQRANPNPNFMNQLIQYQKQLMENYENMDQFKQITKNSQLNKINRVDNRVMHDTENLTTRSMHRIPNNRQCFMQKSINLSIIDKKSNITKLNQNQIQSATNLERDMINSLKINNNDVKKLYVPKLNFQQSIVRIDMNNQKVEKQFILTNNTDQYINKHSSFKQTPKKINVAKSQYFRHNNSQQHQKQTKDLQQMYNIDEEDTDKNKQQNYNKNNTDRSKLSENVSVKHKKNLENKSIPIFQSRASMLKRNLLKMNQERFQQNRDYLKVYKMQQNQDNSVNPILTGRIRMQITNNIYLNRNTPITNGYRSLDKRQKQSKEQQNLTKSRYKPQNISKGLKIIDKKKKSTINTKNQGFLDWFTKLF